MGKYIYNPFTKNFTIIPKQPAFGGHQLSSLNGSRLTWVEQVKHATDPEKITLIPTSPENGFYQLTVRDSGDVKWTEAVPTPPTTGFHQLVVKDGIVQWQAGADPVSKTLDVYFECGIPQTESAFGIIPRFGYGFQGTKTVYDFTTIGSSSYAIELNPQSAGSAEDTSYFGIYCAVPAGTPVTIESAPPLTFVKELRTLVVMVEVPPVELPPDPAVPDPAVPDPVVPEPVFIPVEHYMDVYYVISVTVSTSVKIIIPEPTPEPTPAWAAGTQYKVGDIVQQGGTSYTCYTAHTAPSIFSVLGPGSPAQQYWLPVT